MATERQIEAAFIAFCIFRSDGRNRKRLESAIDAAEAAAWEPIESAPKDGTLFLAWSEMWEETIGITKIWWAADENGWVSEMQSICDWDGEDQPTHWRPLPAPPVAP